MVKDEEAHLGPHPNPGTCVEFVRTFPATLPESFWHLMQGPTEPSQNFLKDCPKPVGTSCSPSGNLPRTFPLPAQKAARWLRTMAFCCERKKIRYLNLTSGYTLDVGLHYDSSGFSFEGLKRNAACKWAHQFVGAMWERLKTTRPNTIHFLFQGQVGLSTSHPHLSSSSA